MLDHVGLNVRDCAVFVQDPDGNKRRGPLSQPRLTLRAQSVADTSIAGGVFPEMFAISGMTTAATMTPAAPNSCFHHERCVGQESGSALTQSVNAADDMTISNMGFSFQKSPHLLCVSGMFASAAFLRIVVAQT